MNSIAHGGVDAQNSSPDYFLNAHLPKDCSGIEDIFKHILPFYLDGIDVCSLALSSRSWKILLKDEFGEVFRNFEEHPFLESKIPRMFHNKDVFEIVEKLFFEIYFKAKPLAKSLGVAEALQRCSLKEFPQVIEDLNFVIFYKNIEIAIPQKTETESLSDYAQNLRKCISHSETAPRFLTLLLMQFQLTTLPKEIEVLRELEVLDLSNNHLSILPDTIGNLPHLMRLNVSQNALHSLPDSIGNLTNLDSLNVSQNELCSLPDSMGNLKELTRLHLSRNQLGTLPQVIRNLGNLTWLNLSSTQIQTLPEFIGTLKKLERLDLELNPLKTLPHSILNLNQLKFLILDGNIHLEIFPALLKQIKSKKIIIKFWNPESLAFLG